LDVLAIAHGGHCVARLDGRVVFVRHALPGEVVLARLDPGSVDDRFWRADAVEVLEASPDRVPARCAISGAGGCGGCDFQHVALSAQLRLKADVLREQLLRLGKVAADDPLITDLVVEAVPGDQEGLGWRTRVGYTVDGQGRAGFRLHRSHEVISAPNCPIAAPEVDEVGAGRLLWKGASRVDVVSGSRQTAGGSPLVVVTPAESVSKDRSGTVRGRPAKVRLPELGSGVSVAIGTDHGLERVRGRVWNAPNVIVAGTSRPFRVSGAGFWQVHPGAAQILVDTVISAADPQPGELALDLYCGVGLFAAAVGEAVGEGGRVWGVESDSRALADARRNLHDLPWVDLSCERVERALWQLAGTTVDLVVLDPPRAGAGRKVIEAVAELAPRRVVYVACDPAALARDVSYAREAGYRLSGLRAFDLFPMTHHMECVAILTRDSDAEDG
jgi:tRNA/tmRNA/rRNA uracil-C5-methylase (TrmA/RlmC/RlmD family)